MGDYVGDPYLYAKFYHDMITPLCPPNMRKCASSDSASFFLVLPTAYSQDQYTDFHDQYVKWRGFGQECAFWGSRKQNFTFRPHFPPKPKIFGHFSTGLRKFCFKKALTMGMIPCKLPLIVIVAQWKLGQKGWERGHVTYFRNVGALSIFREPIELETPNFACRFISRGTNDKNAKLGQKGPGKSHVT